MKALVLTEPGRFDRTSTDQPGDPSTGDALIRIHRVGICGTDLHAFRGRQPFFTYPRIIGHELGAEVIAIGDDVDQVQVGDHVAVEPYLDCGDCGDCLPCRRGRPNCCETLQVLGVHTDGGMRESITLPARKLHRSSTLALEQLALVETLGIGAHAVERAQLQQGKTVLVVGAGPIGLETLQFAALVGARVHVLEPNEKRRAFARDHFDVAECHIPGGMMLRTCGGLWEIHRRVCLMPPAVVRPWKPPLTCLPRVAGWFSSVFSWSRCLSPTRISTGAN